MGGESVTTLSPWFPVYASRKILSCYGFTMNPCNSDPSDLKKKSDIISDDDYITGSDENSETEDHV